MGESDKEKLPKWFKEAREISQKYKYFLDSSYDGYKHTHQARRSDVWHLNSKEEGHWFPIIKKYDFLDTFRFEELSKTFLTSYPINEDIKPRKPYFPDEEEIEAVDKIINTDLLELARINNSAKKNYYEKWNHRDGKRWEEYKAIAKRFKEEADDLLLRFKTIYVDERTLSLKAIHSVAAHAEQILKANLLPAFFHPFYRIQFDDISGILLITFDFPDYKDEKIAIGSNAKGDKPKYASETAKKKLVKETLYGLIVWIGHVVASQIAEEVNQIAINARQSWFDPATGSPTEGTIASVLADREYLAKLNIEKVDPIACFKQMKGLVTPSLEKQTSIRPIFEMNMDDSRLVDSKDVDGSLEEGSNLAAMPWEDFEHLVAQLFEWQFAKDGTEVKVTQASRDRGVDAIVFDPDPFMGGKYVLQAKRYTNTVDVASVRDLYGTVMNEGANRGILITTSSYGPDAYEFAKDKPISLVDGPNLLNLLREHGKKYKIDLEEAKLLNKDE
tara:strand:- start:844 stop:2349 length:1506 start_codon:yes stop_codon:yes gene_type:complete